MNALGRLILPLALVAAVACDADKRVEAKPASADKSAAAKPAPAKASPPAKAAEAKVEPPAIEVSDAMKTFMTELGEHDKVTAAIEKYGAKGLEADMGMYNIEEARVTASQPGAADGETCYAMQAKTGMVQRKFRICWKGDKITAAENKGLATGS